MDDLVIRFANEDDAEGILAVYTPYILDTTITYEYDIPSIENMKQRIQGVQSFYPYLVCTYNHEIVGYAYASKHKERAAFQWGAEISVYIKEDFHGSGVASRLYDRIIAFLYEQGIYKLYALIDAPNEKSERFHLKRGFKEIGSILNTAYKLGKWCNLKYYEKTLRECKEEPAPLRSIYDIEKTTIGRIMEL
jgi:phosphinothricin acetyltransferase